MTRHRKILTLFLSACGMIVLILDSKTAITGASEGIEICMRTVIPSLFPFFVLSVLLTSSLSGASIPFFAPVGKLFRIPEGMEHILLIGLLGGYPVGAQTVAQSYTNGYLNKHDAHRMLGFCSNAGPAFIFGIVGSLFSSKKTALFLWIIHILSALFVAMIIPGKADRRCQAATSPLTTLPQALSKALRIMASVCGWIILFRILITFLNRWFLWLLPKTVSLLIIGILECANGCYCLMQARSEAVRFILCSVILGFGSICVGMQTISVTAGLGTGWYFPGKFLQALFSLLLSAIVAQYLFKDINGIAVLLAAVPILILGIFIICKKRVAFLDNRVYNN